MRMTCGTILAAAMAAMVAMAESKVVKDIAYADRENEGEKGAEGLALYILSMKE